MLHWAASASIDDTRWMRQRNKQRVKRVGLFAPFDFVHIIGVNAEAFDTFFISELSKIEVTKDCISFFSTT